MLFVRGTELGRRERFRRETRRRAAAENDAIVKDATGDHQLPLPLSLPTPHT